MLKPLEVLMVVIYRKKIYKISIKDILEAIEGPVAITKYTDDNNKKCNLLNTCITKNVWTQVNSSVLKLCIILKLMILQKK